MNKFKTYRVVKRTLNKIETIESNLDIEPALDLLERLCLARTYEQHLTVQYGLELESENE